jgi:flagellar motor switch protein FliN
MSLDQATEDKFNQIAKVLAIEVSAKLSSLLKSSVTVSYSRLIDSIMVNKKIAVKKDSFLVATPITTNNLGPVSVIATNQQVAVISDLVMGGEGNAAENVVPEENNEKIFAETIHSVICAAIARLCTFKEGLILTTGESEARSLKSATDDSLTLPNDIDDSIGIGCKIKISTKLDTPLQVELNAKTINFLVAELGTLIDELDEEKLAIAINQEYQSSATTSTEADDGAVTAVVDDLGSEYKVDEKRNLSFLSDINVDLILELGRSEMLMKDILKLTKGSAIELDRPCNQAIDLYVHNQLVARGEVVAIDDSFGLKVTELVGNLNLAGDFGLKAR